jgi:hypothetical protein
MNDRMTTGVGERVVKLLPHSWSFLCFTEEVWGDLEVMLNKRLALGRGLHVTRVEIPGGTLPPFTESCHAVFVPKHEWDRHALHKALKEQFGYEDIDEDSDLFTLGVRSDHDSALGAAGRLFRRFFKGGSS